jgi:hypothetical protein
MDSAPTLERVLVAGWQDRNGRTVGYWWYYEDVTDEAGIPEEHPNALLWRRLPAAPKDAPTAAMLAARKRPAS